MCKINKWKKEWFIIVGVVPIRPTYINTYRNTVLHRFVEKFLKTLKKYRAKNIEQNYVQI